MTGETRVIREIKKESQTEKQNKILAVIKNKKNIQLQGGNSSSTLSQHPTDVKQWLI